MRYNSRKIEAKWQKKWLQEKIYEPDLKKAKRPFYNLMMFPYPSGEGLHVGHAYTFSGADIFGRFKRMRGQDVFQPIGYDSFGIHSENYALKIGEHPKDLMQKTTKRYEGQLKSLGIGYAWDEELKTSDPAYYHWTQWIFLQLFKNDLAYRKKSPVNWCVSCKTVLADEQVVGGECERCSNKVIKKELEQWFFRITNYAGRLLKNLEHIDWSEKIKIAQKNWIGKSEGALIKFPVSSFQFPIKDCNFVFIHGYKGGSQKVFWPWLKREIEKRGSKVFAPDLPNPTTPKIDEQVAFLLKNHEFNEKTIIVTHSLGGVVAMKLLPALKGKIRKLYMIAPPLRLEFRDGKKRPPLETACDWKFDFEKIKQAAEEIVVLADEFDHVVTPDQPAEIAQKLSAKYKIVKAEGTHFNSLMEPEILDEIFSAIEVFTTRPDTLFGATYMVLAPEHNLIQNSKFKIHNWPEVESYIKRSAARGEAERIAEGREKTGVELKGIKVINPASGEEIPIWVADYVLGQVGTGAIMAVPAHDQRDYEFAIKFGLPIKRVIEPSGALIQNSKFKGQNYNVKFKNDNAHEGAGFLVNSDKFDGMESERAKWEIANFVGGAKKVQYRLRDWLISRQRYWGPPIPLIFCENCKKSIAGSRTSRGKSDFRKLDRGELENPGWIAVPEKDLPVRLPYLKNFRPTGTEKSPLASAEKFYKVRCPKCKSWARRETDVSDTFLDSAWYYLRYPSVRVKNSKLKIQNYNVKFKSSEILEVPWNQEVTETWLPVDMYIGGAEHAVLHLLYVRFLAMALYDLGFLHFEEPFKKFCAHGLLIKDGAKMSKSRGNVVNPDDYIRAYGADALRMYLMFLGPFEQGGDFRDTGIRGITRFLERVWRLAQEADLKNSKFQNPNSKQIPKSKSQVPKTTDRILHRTIKKVTEDIEGLQYNTAISALMILLSEFEKNSESVVKEDIKIFLKLLAPFAPHISEELYQQFVAGPKSKIRNPKQIQNSKFKKSKQFYSIHHEKWPVCDSRLTKEDTFELVIQVNGKVRGRVQLSIGATEAEAKQAAQGLENIKQHLISEPRKIIFIPNKLMNFVT